MTDRNDGSQDKDQAERVKEKAHAMLGQYASLLTSGVQSAAMKSVQSGLLTKTEAENAIGLVWITLLSASMSPVSFARRHDGKTDSEKEEGALRDMEILLGVLSEVTAAAKDALEPFSTF